MDDLIATKGLGFLSNIEYPDISIRKGSITFICGESGCGKSSLLKILNGTISPARGKIFYKGEDCENIDTIKLRRDVLLVSQSVFLFDGSIEENFRSFFSYCDSPLPDEKEMMRALDICCVDMDIKSPCETMSGGERQRVLLAAAVAMRPTVLMLDEPTSALDSITADLLMGKLICFCRETGTTLISVSHDITLAQKYGETVILLEKGMKA